MFHIKMLPGVISVFSVASFLFGQVKSEAIGYLLQEPALPPVETHTSADAEKRLAEIVTYRFHLSYPAASCDLLVSNSTGAAAFFTLRGISLQSEGVPAPDNRTIVNQGESVRVPAARAQWASFDWVLVEAPRRAQLSLCSGNEGNGDEFNIQGDGHARAFDIFTFTRPPTISNWRRRVILLVPGSKSKLSLDLEPGADVAASSRKLLTGKSINANLQLFMVFDLN